MKALVFHRPKKVSIDTLEHSRAEDNKDWLDVSKLKKDDNCIKVVFQP